MKGLKKAIVAMGLLTVVHVWAEEPTLTNTAVEMQTTDGAITKADDTAAPAWEVIGTDDGIVTEKREWDDSPVVEFRGSTIINSRLSKIVSVLSDTSRKLEWVDRAKEAKDLEVISKLERVEYNHSTAPWPVKDRDFVFKASATPDLARRTLLVTLKSVDHTAMPEQDCCVRGEITNSSYKLEALEDGSKTRVTVQILADPKGSVPKWIVNLIQKSWPRKTLQRLAAQAAKTDVVEHAYYRQLFEQSQQETAHGASAVAPGTTSAL